MNAADDAANETRAEWLVDELADAALAFAQGLGPATFEQHGPAFFAAYLHAAVQLLAAMLAAGGER